MFTEEQIGMLNAKLDKSAVKDRTQAGRKLSYIEGWHAIAEANRIFGHGRWSRETVDIKCVSERERKIGRPPNDRDGWGVTYTARVRVSVGETVRDGVGAGHGIDVDPGQAHESAIKEAETDAMKRALSTFGWPFGLALYDKDQEHVETGAPKKDPPKSEAGTTTEQLRAAFKSIMDGIAKAANPEGLQALMKARAADIQAIKDTSEEGYAKIMAASTKRTTELSQAPLPN